MVSERKVYEKPLILIEEYQMVDYLANKCKGNETNNMSLTPGILVSTPGDALNGNASLVFDTMELPVPDGIENDGMIIGNTEQINGSNKTFAGNQGCHS